MNMRAWLMGLLMFVSAAGGAQSPPEVHGSADAYAARGVTLAWGIVRGPTEADTFVVIRIATDAQIYPWLAVAGVNPFSKAERLLHAATQVGGGVDVQIFRSRFAEFPRTEVRLYESASKAQTGPPALTVFYLGVPDTTPEFADKGKLDAYLSDRMARVRAGTKTP